MSGVRRNPNEAVPGAMAPSGLPRAPTSRIARPRSSIQGPKRLAKPATLTIPRSPITPKPAHGPKVLARPTQPGPMKPASTSSYSASQVPKIPKMPYPPGTTTTRPALPRPSMASRPLGSASPKAAEAKVRPAAPSRPAGNPRAQAAAAIATTRSLTSGVPRTTPGLAARKPSPSPARTPIRPKPNVPRTDSPGLGRAKLGTSAKQAQPSLASQSGAAKKLGANSKPWLRPKQDRLAMSQQQAFDPLYVSPEILKQARASGKLNLSNRGMPSIPNDVFSLYDSREDDAGSFDSEPTERWWDAVPLSRLILSDNEIAAVDSRIGIDTTLTYLDMRNNGMSELPDEMSELNQLKFLSIAGNNFKQLPKCIFGLPLIDIKAQRNKISDIPSEVERLAQTLASIDLSSNELAQLPNEITALSKLSQLNLNDNLLTKLPDGLANFSGLKELDVSRNRLTSLFFNSPESVDDSVVMMHLTRIDATENQIVDLASDPTTSVSLPQLKELLLGMNRISSVPQTVLEGLPQLVTLDLHNNRLDGSFYGLKCLPDLERLDISGNLYRQLPSEIGYLGQLQSINFDGNPLRRRPPSELTSEIVKWLGDKMESDSQSPNLSNPTGSTFSENATNQKRSLFPTKFDPYQTNSGTLKLERYAKYDVLAKSTKEEISDESKSLPFSVRILILQNNSIESLPFGLISAFFATLTTLDLSHNHISAFPFTSTTESGEGVFQGAVLPHVRSLNLAYNRIFSWPGTEVGKIFPALRELNLGYNQLTELPKPESTPIRDALGTKELVEVFLTKNKIAEISPQAFKGLTILNLADNEISHVPFELGLVDTIQSIDLNGNRFRVPRREIMNRGTAVIMEWLRDRIPN